MTTNNHPAHGPVSLERLHQISGILSKAAAQSDGGNLGYAMADAVKVIDGVIAACDAKPVAWKAGNRAFVTRVVAEMYACEIMTEIQPLYTTPPSPAYLTEAQRAMLRDMDEEIVSELDKEEKSYRDGIRKCIASLRYHHKRAEAHSTGYKGSTLEDDTLKSINFLKINNIAAMLQAANSPVTPDGWQLVPKEPTDEMNKAGWAAMNEHDAINPTYRAMLAAAPQQDVK